jgi:hypothetical protein
MKGSLLIPGLLVMMALPVQAGQLIVRETETAIIVEYTGDSTGKETGTPLENQPAFKKLVQMAARPAAVVDGTNLKDNSKAAEEKRKSFVAAKKRAEEVKASKWSGKTASEKFD